MKSVMMIFILALTFLTSTTGYAAPTQNLPVRVDSRGVSFPDNSLQSTAAILPECKPGEVYVFVGTGMVCAKIKPIQNGIATCIANACTVSSCLDGLGNCDPLNPNVCGTDVLSSAINCGACGTVCTTQNECATPVCSNGLCGGTSPKVIGTPCSTGICDGIGVCVPSPVCGNGIVEFGEQCDDGNTSNSDGCTNTCTFPSCNDQVKNGAETDVDCGGGLCKPCDSGRLCLKNLDCASGTCNSGACQ